MRTQADVGRSYSQIRRHRPLLFSSQSDTRTTVGRFQDGVVVVLPRGLRFCNLFYTLFSPFVFFQKLNLPSTGLSCRQSGSLIKDNRRSCDNRGLVSDEESGHSQARSYRLSSISLFYIFSLII